MRRFTRNHSRRGLAAVETALVIPLLLMVTFAVIEYGWMFMKVQQITGATRNAARLAITPDATGADVQALIDAQLAAAGLGDSGYSVTVLPGDIDGMTPGESLTVAVSAPYGNITVLGMPFIPAPSNLSARVTMAKEGP